MTGPVLSRRTPFPTTAIDLQVVVARAGPAVTVISVAGRLDMTATGVFATAMAGAVSAVADGRVVAELNRLTYFGAGGLGVVLAAHGDAARRGGSVLLVVDEVAPAAVTLGLLPPGRGPDVHPTLTAALAATGSGPGPGVPRRRSTSAGPTPSMTAGPPPATDHGTER